MCVHTYKEKAGKEVSLEEGKDSVRVHVCNHVFGNVLKAVYRQFIGQ